MMQQYKEFVLARVSPPRTLTDVEFHVIHGAIGLATESLELFIADKNRDTLNEAEELGDLLFYLVFLANSIMVDPVTLPLHSAFMDKAPPLDNALEELVSFCKKVVIYNQDKYAELRVQYLATWNAFVADLDVRGYSIPTLIKANTDKLSKRYKEKFTVKESINRADKEEQ